MRHDFHKVIDLGTEFNLEDKAETIAYFSSTIDIAEIDATLPDGQIIKNGLVVYKICFDLLWEIIDFPACYDIQCFLGNE